MGNPVPRPSRRTPTVGLTRLLPSGAALALAAGLAAQTTVPAGFVDEHVLNAGESPAALKFSPAGDLYFARRIQGELWRVPFGQWSSPRLLYTFDVPKDGSGKPAAHRSSGLRDFTFSADGRSLFVFYMKNNPRQNRLVRLAIDPGNPDRVIPGSETLLLDLPFNGGSASGSHNGGAVEIGSDGMVYVTTGDGWSGGDNVQSLSTHTGKVFRVAQDGSIPTDNPFYGQTWGPYRAVYALGCRNPFSMSWNAGDGRLYVNETTGTNKGEVFRVDRGANFGHQGFGGIGTYAAAWTNASAVAPLNTGGAWYDGWRFQSAQRSWPSTYHGGYFVCQWGDNNQTPGSIVFVPPGNRWPQPFAGSMKALDPNGALLKPTCVRVGPDGHLYYLMTTYDTSQGEVRRIRYGGGAAAQPPGMAPNGGTFTGATNVSLWSSTPGAAIHYTMDGSTPTQSSTRYWGTPFVVASSAVVKARAFASGMQPSAVVQAAFTINSVTNVAPVAIAGPRQTVWPVDRLFTLNGSASYDPDGSASLLSEMWVQVAGPPVPGFDGGDFVSFFTPRQVGLYRFRLDVCDPSGACASDTVDVVVVPCLDDVLDGLSHRWLLDEGGGLQRAYDSSPGAIHGALRGGVGKSSSGAYPASAAAMVFDGVDDRIELGSEFDPSGSALTVAAWLKADDFGVPDARILSKTRGANEGDHHVMLSTVANGASTRLRFRLKTSGWTATLVASGGGLTAGRWVHAAAVYDGAEMRLFQDGVLVGRMAKQGSIDSDPSVPAAIGNQPLSAAGGGRAFDGVIDDVRIYDRALSVADLGRLARRSTILSMPAWCGCHRDLGFASPGGAQLTLCGAQRRGTPWDLRLTQAAPNAPVALLVGLLPGATPALGGTLVPQPLLSLIVAPANARGELLARRLSGFIAPTTFVVQALSPDPSAAKGLAFSNAVQLVTR